MTITITDPELIEKLSKVDDALKFVRPDGSVILEYDRKPRNGQRLADLSPFSEEELARRREEVRKNPVGRTWSEIRKDLEAMG